MSIVIVAEKSSAAARMAEAFFGDERKRSGIYKGQALKIVNLVGHLYEFVDPDQMVSAELQPKYKSWRIANLPWDHTDMQWKKRIGKDRSGRSHKDTIAKLKPELNAATEIVIGTDVDPSGEGGMLAIEVFEALGLLRGNKHKFSRMVFFNDTPEVFRDAFDKRVSVPNPLKLDEYLKADARSKFDLMSMQWTRIASGLARNGEKNVVLRQGRLKSAMVVIVGDQLAAYNNYAKIPFFENRFKDENGVWYRNPEEPRFAKREDVPNTYRSSAVKKTGVQRKKVAPPKLLTLGSLSAVLAKSGYKAKDVDKAYQSMYEAQLLSYPRTADKFISSEQYVEMLPLVDRIAAVVGVNPKLLTHKAERKTHIKSGGTHGANRPGLKVPQSLDDVRLKYGNVGAAIYDLLARNYLAMMCEDYEYDSESGCLVDYPAFVGTASVPRVAGWKAIYGTDDDDLDDRNDAGLGTKANPQVFEGYPPRATYPTQGWLIAQLEKRDIGTGATQNSTFADVSNEKGRCPLLSVNKTGKLSLTEYGEQSYYLLQGTHIGDLAVTEYLQNEMVEAAAGRKTSDEIIAIVADWIRDDIKTMTANAVPMRKELNMSEGTTEKEKVEGTWNGAEVRFSRVWSTHRFTDAEAADLLAGKVITFDAVSSAGKPYKAKGSLAKQTFNTSDGKTVNFVGFKPDFSGIPAAFCGHTFTTAEAAKLEAGEEIWVTGMVSKKGSKFDAFVSYGNKDDGSGKGINLRFKPRS